MAKPDRIGDESPIPRESTRRGPHWFKLFCLYSGSRKIGIHPGSAMAQEFFQSHDLFGIGIRRNRDVRGLCERTFYVQNSPAVKIPIGRPGEQRRSGGIDARLDLRVAQYALTENGPALRHLLEEGGIIHESRDPAVSARLREPPLCEGCAWRKLMPQSEVMIPDRAGPD